MCTLKPVKIATIWPSNLEPLLLELLLLHPEVSASKSPKSHAPGFYFKNRFLKNVDENLLHFSELLPPTGCAQYFTGSGPSHVQTFNYNAGNGRHLADQDQLICVRRESGMCAICWSADAETDVQLGGKAAAMGGVKVK